MKNLKLLFIKTKNAKGITDIFNVHKDKDHLQNKFLSKFSIQRYHSKKSNN